MVVETMIHTKHDELIGVSIIEQNNGSTKELFLSKTDITRLFEDSVEVDSGIFMFPFSKKNKKAVKKWKEMRK